MHRRREEYEASVDRRDEAAAALAVLTRRERLVMMTSTRDMVYREIAALIGVTEQRIQQIHDKAVRKMRRWAERREREMSTIR